MRIIIFLSIIFSVGYSVAEPVTDDDKGNCLIHFSDRGHVFSLGIARSFRDDVEFKLCVSEDTKDSYLLVATSSNLLGSKGYRRGEPPPVVSEIKVSMDAVAYDRLLKLYDLALDYDVRDEVEMLDGSTWCLESLYFDKVFRRACFRSPDYEPERRKLRALNELGRAFWTIATVEINLGEL